MKIQLVIIFILVNVINLFSQPVIQWQKCIGGSNYDRANSICYTTDGGYVVAGLAVSNDGNIVNAHGQDDAFIVKINEQGILQWSKNFGGTNDDVAMCINQTSDGGYIVVGGSDSNDGDVIGHHGAGDVWVVKLDTNGMIQWQKCYGGTNADFGYFIQQTLDGGYIISGETSSNDGDVIGNHGLKDVFILSIDSVGAIQWQKCMGGTGDDYAMSIKQTIDGGYIVAGLAGSNNGDVIGNHGSTDDYWIVKLNEFGGIQWQKCFGGTYNEEIMDIQLTTDGGYVVAGSTFSNNGDVIGNHASFTFDWWILKLDSIGTLQWQKCLGGTNYDRSESIQQCLDGGYIVVGYTGSSDGDVIGFHGSPDYWVVKLNAAGSIEWSKCLGGTLSDYAHFVMQTSDGGYIISGETQSNDGDVMNNQGGYDMWLVKFSNFIGISEVDKDESTFIIFPNPIDSRISIPSNLLYFTEFILTDLQGRIIQEGEISQKNNGEIDVTGIAAGIYILHLKDENVRIYSKIIKE